MNIHQKAKKPVIIIDFDKAIFNNGKGFPISYNSNINTIPLIKEKLRILFHSLRKRFKIILYTRNHLYEALLWVIRNKLDKDCIHSVTRRKSRHTFYFEKL